MKNQIEIEEWSEYSECKPGKVDTVSEFQMSWMRFFYILQRHAPPEAQPAKTEKNEFIQAFTALGKQDPRLGLNDMTKICR